mmetsp:Transcript_56539/g.138947  ORF Transcript_56539/g.138947 Transcript_56539/m.138947 type:complete len:439 (-) Transcript_56539:320-1636(-)
MEKPETVQEAFLTSCRLALDDGDSTVFGPRSPLGQFLTVPSSAASLLALGPDAIESSFLVEIYQMMGRTSYGPVTPLASKAMALLYVPEFKLGSWVLGRCFRVTEPTCKLDFAQPNTLRDDDSSLFSADAPRVPPMDVVNMDESQPLLWSMSRFIFNLQDCSQLYTVVPTIDGRTMVMRTKIGRRGSFESTALVIRREGHIDFECLSMAICEFCSMRGVDCDCPREWRARGEQWSLSVTEWNDLMKVAKANESYFSQTKLQISQKVNGERYRLDLTENFQYHFNGESPELRAMRRKFAELLQGQAPSPQNRANLLSNEETTSLLAELLEDDISLGSALTSSGDDAVTLLDRPHQCSVCLADFQSRSNLLRHRVEVHAGKKSHSCDVCGKRFSQKSNLQRHVRAVHLHDKPFSCTLCNVSCVTLANLKRHQKLKHPGFE